MTRHRVGPGGAQLVVGPDLGLDGPHRAEGESGPDGEGRGGGQHAQPEDLDPRASTATPATMPRARTIAQTSAAPRSTRRPPATIVGTR